MSYILDALKKSEQERQKHNGPTLQTVHRPLITESRSGAAFWFLVVLCCVLSIALATAVWRYMSSAHHFASLPAQTVEAVPAPAVAVESVQSEPALTAPLHEQARGMATETVEDKPTVEPAPVDMPAQVIEFWELPDPVQREIPPLTFSFHVYSTNPERRTIIINKRRAKEGEQVSDGLRLVEITMTGVVLQWERFLFRVNVVEQW